MSHGALPPTTMPAALSASRTSSFARLVSNCDNNSLAVALADTMLLPFHAVQHEVDELGRRQSRAREHPREPARDEAIGGACRLRLAIRVALEPARGLDHAKRAAVIGDQRMRAEV